MKFHESYCSDHSPEGSHHFVFLGSSIWSCKYCLTVVWRPMDWLDTLSLTAKIRRLGRDKAYEEALSKRPKVKKMLEELNELKKTVSKKIFIEEAKNLIE